MNDAFSVENRHGNIVIKSVVNSKLTKNTRTANISRNTTVKKTFSKLKRGKEYERADTGDDFDDRFDTVLPIEWISPADPCDTRTESIGEGKGIIIKPEPMRGNAPELSRGMNVKPSGSTIKEGTLLAEAGTRITPFDIAALATGGYKEVKVIKKPVIGFIPTGSELVPAGSKIKRGQNFDSNSLMVNALLSEMGASVICADIVKDDPEKLSAELDSMLSKCDIVLLNGGSSKGEEDYNTRLMEKRGDMLFHWVLAAPGRPMSAAIVSGRLVVDLAGPAIAAYHGIDWCIRDAVSYWYKDPASGGNFVTAELEKDLPAPPLSILMRMKVTEHNDGTLTAAPIGGGGPGKHPGIAMPEANGTYATKAGGPDLKKGDSIRIRMVR